MEEKLYSVKLKHFEEDKAYLNMDEEDYSFFFSDYEEINGVKTKFTKEFLVNNHLGWMFDSEGIMLIEEEDD